MNKSRELCDKLFGAIDRAGHDDVADVLKIDDNIGAAIEGETFPPGLYVEGCDHCNLLTGVALRLLAYTLLHDGRAAVIDRVEAMELQSDAAALVVPHKRGETQASRARELARVLRNPPQN